LKLKGDQIETARMYVCMYYYVKANRASLRQN
jgi:hypothetical protein